MEQLLLILFILFSVVSSLLERRKRQRRLEEARQKQAHPAPEPETAELEEEEEDWGGWPMPPGDPFEPRPSPRRHPAPMAPGHLETGPPPVDAEPEVLLKELERQARQAEEQACLQEALAAARQRQLQSTQARRQGHGPMHRPAAPRPGRRRAARYRLTPTKAREAVVWAEILGPCKAEGRQEDRW